MTSGLLIGRFQPFTLGHEDAIKQMSAHCDTIIIGIGSSQEVHTLRNPFSASERKAMIVASGVLNEIKHRIIYLPDINYPLEWVEHIEQVADAEDAQFDEVWTGNGFTMNLFRARGWPVKLLKLNKSISGTKVRESMLTNSWKEYVSPNVCKIINIINGAERVSQIIAEGRNSEVKYDQLLW